MSDEAVGASEGEEAAGKGEVAQDSGPPIPAATTSAASEPTVKATPEIRAAVVWLFLVGFGVVFFWNAWERDFWNPNEIRFAHVTRTMEASGDWLVPKLADKPYFHLPPFMYWIAGASHQLTGLDERLSYRLPVAIISVLGLLLTYVAGRRLFSGRVGFLAVAIQASGYLYYRRSAWLDDDLVFAVACQLAVIGLAIGTRKDSGRGWAWLGWTGLAVASLTKSVLLSTGLVFGVLVLFLFFDREEKSVREPLHRVASRLHVAYFIALVAPWFLIVGREHGVALWSSHFQHYHFDQMVSADHMRYPSYYLIHILIDYMPWTLLLPLAILQGKDRVRNSGERFALFGLLFTLVALSFVSSKKPGYILFAWPFLSLLIAAGLFESRQEFSLWEGWLRLYAPRVFPYVLRAPLVLVLIVGGVYYWGYLPLAISFVVGQEDRVTALFEDGKSVQYGLAFAAAAGALLWFHSGRVRKLALDRESARATFEFACATAFVFFVSSFFYEGFNTVKSSRPFTADLRSVVQDAPLATYGRKRPAANYYMERDDIVHLRFPHKTIRDDPAIVELDRYLSRSEQVFVLAESEDLRRLRRNYSLLRPKLHEHKRGHLGWTREYVLLSNKPPGPAE